MEQKLKLTVLILVTSCVYFKDRVYIFNINEDSFSCETKYSETEYSNCSNFKTKEHFNTIHITKLIPVKVKIKE